VRRLLLLLAGGALLTGCAGDLGPAGPALRDTAQRLGKIETADLHVSLQIEPKHGDPFGYELEGPVELAGEGELPAADVRYRQFANGVDETVRLVLTKDGGWVERGGERTDLTDVQLAELQQSGSLLGQKGLETLNFEQWTVDPELSDGPDATEKVTADLDVLTAMTGLASLSGLLGGTTTLSAADRRRVAEQVDDSHFELLTGKDDRLLRKLALGFTLDEDVPQDLRAAIGDDAVGAEFSFELELDRINEPVELGG
jgi:hypothetical protein